MAAKKIQIEKRVRRLIRVTLFIGYAGKTEMPHYVTSECSYCHSYKKLSELCISLENIEKIQKTK